MYVRYEVEELYDRYGQDVYRYVLSMCQDPHTAEDVTQMAFVRVITGILHFRGECAIKTWIFSIARNEYLRWLKKNPPTVPLEEQYAAAVKGDLAEHYLDKEQAEFVMKYIYALKEPQRSLMILRLINGFTFREAAQVLERSEVWARVTFMREKARLVESLKEELE